MFFNTTKFKPDDKAPKANSRILNGHARHRSIQEMRRAKLSLTLNMSSLEIQAEMAILTGSFALKQDCRRSSGFLPPSHRAGSSRAKGPRLRLRGQQ